MLYDKYGCKFPVKQNFYLPLLKHARFGKLPMEHGIEFEHIRDISLKKN